MTTLILTSIAFVPAPAGSQMLYAPFTANVVLTFNAEDPEDKAGVFSATFFRKSDGSWATIEETEAYDNERGTQQEVLDVASRTWVSSSSFTRTFIKQPLTNDRQIKTSMYPWGDCTFLSDGTWKRIGDSERLGLKVVEVEVRLSERLMSRLSVAPAVTATRFWIF